MRIKKSVKRPAEAAAPTYTLRADRRFDLLAMVTIVSLAEAGEAPAEKIAALKATLREFELYEEKYMR
ncbi:hypothetical protein LCGC14_3140650 [marine sediment metagenome]|uniref:Uncharacterized protein n=1 Tax=marine sediment metagenome TaxID=412755 RepID=A0A0F8VWV8_9ZZZZ